MALTQARDSGIEALWRIARTLGRRAAWQKRLRQALPPLWFVTDPIRTPDPAQVLEQLPRGSGVIYRAFGAPDASDVGRLLRRIATRRGLILLIGADARLAARVGADGVHLPERLMFEAPGLRAHQPDWLITGAAHSARALHGAGKVGLDAALLSPVFDSRSPSAGRALGAVRFASLVREASVPVIGLGGVRPANALQLVGTGAAGLAAVEALAVPPKR